MKYKIFTYSVPPPEEPEDLNGFLSSSRVVSVQSHIVVKKEIPYLIFIVEYLDSKKGKHPAAPKIDYREKLSEEDFIIFSQLRDLRKSLAEKDGVPVYAVFTNAQLAQMVEMRINNRQGLFSIQGVGESKVGKYGDTFIDLCREMFSGLADTHKEETIR
ncbi:MAG: HRDC domain-containing protein [Desulfobacula sp.]|jgi:superfamily II DNA helicase RecQ|nr:HRDC domain-containing protein [Desulfobacula sp.]